MARRAKSSPLVYGAVGFEFAGIVVVSILLGYQVDQYLGTEPLFLLLLTVGGFVAAVKRLLWSLKRRS